MTWDRFEPHFSLVWKSAPNHDDADDDDVCDDDDARDDEEERANM